MVIYVNMNLIEEKIKITNEGVLIKVLEKNINYIFLDYFKEGQFRLAWFLQRFLNGDC